MSGFDAILLKMLLMYGFSVRYSLLVIHYSRYWVVAVAAPRVAATDALHTKPTALDDAMLLHGFYHVLRAGRCVAAGVWQKRRNSPLVKLNEPNE
jgi:hypothetical protein